MSSAKIPTGGLTVSPEMRQLSEKPGPLRAFGGGQRLRDLYTEGTTKFDPTKLSSFGLKCYVGLLDEIEKGIELGTAPDITSYETPFKWGYVTLVVMGAQIVVLKHDRQPTGHLKVLQYLFKMGAPLDLRDIAGYTALHHACIRNAVPLLARKMLELGANPDWVDRYGSPAMHGAMMSKQVAIVELLLEFGASLDIKDADGFALGPTNFTLFDPEVAAPIHKWLRKQKGETAPLEGDGCDACGKQPAVGDKKFAICSVCKMVRYCSSTCQKLQWPQHKGICEPAGPTNSLTFKPHYDNMILVSPLEAARQAFYPEIHTRPNAPNKAKKVLHEPPQKPFDGSSGKGLIVKVQIPRFQSNSGPSLADPLESHILVYNKKRDFQCNLRRSDDVKAYDTMLRLIQEKGAGGLKAYFRAELPSRDRLVIRTSEVLAEQPF